MSDKTQFVQHPVTQQWLDNSDGMALADVDMAYCFADEGAFSDEEPPSLIEQHYAQEKALWTKRLAAMEAQPFFSTVTNFLDLFLESASAESTIGDLSEQYLKRIPRGATFAKWWLGFQVGYIVLGRVIDLYGRFAKARAGK